MEYFSQKIEGLIKGLLILLVLSALIWANNKFVYIRDGFNMSMEKDYSVINNNEYSLQDKKEVCGEEIIAQIKALKANRAHEAIVVVRSGESERIYGYAKDSLDYIDYCIWDKHSEDYIDPSAYYQKRYLFDNNSTRIEYRKLAKLED